MYQAISPLPNGRWPEDGLETLRACPVCGSQDRAVLHHSLRDNIFFCAAGLWTMWRCEDCRSAYLDPRPTPETIHLAYRDYYTHAPPATAQETGQLSLPRKIRRTMANGYRNWRYGSRYAPASSVGVAVGLAFASLRRPLDVAFRYLPHPANSEGRRVLDIGCGGGGFLDLAASAGWSASGCDPDPIAVENARARGLDVRQGGVEAWADAESSFDAITLSHVIEHVHDPVATIRTAFRLLRPGGQLYMDTPNIEALGHEAYGPYWRGLDPPRHLVLFGWNSCTRMLAGIGFEEIKPHIRPDIMAGIAIKSARAAAGIDPASQDGSTAGAGISLRTRSRFARHRSEFITLTAQKPE